MTPKELMRVIVRTEQEARNTYDAALAEESAFSSELEKEKAQLREEIQKKAEKKAEQIQADAAKRADAEIQRLDARLEREMNRAKDLFENNQEALMEKVFRIVVGLDG